jgi:uncharacterized protein
MRRALLLILLVAGAGCTSVFFQPQRTLVRTPADIGVAYEDVFFSSSDGVRLHGWFLPARGQAIGTVLFLHGNAENISTHLASVHWLPERGFNVFLLDYRGYGLSAGRPTLAGVQNDIGAAVQVLRQRPDVDPNKVILFGQSLGGALAIYYAGQRENRGQFRALITESAFASYRGITREALAGSWLTWPFQWLALTIDNDYSALAAAAQVSPTPFLIVHGDRDYIVPPNHAQRLYQAASEPKELWVVPGAGHIETFRHPGYRSKLVDYLKRQLQR